MCSSDLENKQRRPNDESTSPRGLSSHFDSHICCVANENDSGSTNKDEEEERSFVQLYARLNQEDKAVMLKLLERAREQSEARQRLEDILSMKMLHLDELTKEHEELKCSHVDLVQRYHQDIILHIQAVYQWQVRSMHSLIRVWFLNPFRLPNSQCGAYNLSLIHI